MNPWVSGTSPTWLPPSTPGTGAERPTVGVEHFSLDPEDLGTETEKQAEVVNFFPARRSYSELDADRFRVVSSASFARPFPLSCFLRTIAAKVVSRHRGDQPSEIQTIHTPYCPKSRL